MWRSYESVVQGIFQLLVDQDSVHNVRVEHNVTLQGKSAPHQVDVYWKFEMGGVPHETIFQAKHWSKAVDKGELLKFKAVIDDFPGSTGVFVTKIRLSARSARIRIQARNYPISIRRIATPKCKYFNAGMGARLDLANALA